MLVRWDPMQEMDTVQREINRLFNEYVPGRARRTEGAEVMWAPRVDTFEDKDAFLISVDLPGLTQKEVRINLDNEVLSISGERRLEHEDKKENYQRVERFYGTFNRSFTLPPMVNPEKIEAKMENGVLTVALPKKEESKPKQIEIKAR